MRYRNAKRMTQRRFDLPPLNQLEAFEAAARHLSFTRAADELALTQSAVSRQIAALEEHFGHALFRRLHRALRLTEDGQALYHTTGEVLKQLEQVSSRIRRQPRGKTVVVTTTPGFAGLWLIPRLPGFTATRPDVDVRISANYTIAVLERDGIDLAIRYQAEPESGTAARRLFGEVVMPVCSPRLQHDAARPLAQPDDLRHHVLLHMEGDAAGQLLDWPMWLRAMKHEGLKPAGVLHFSLYDQMIQAAVNDQGVALGRLPLIDALLQQRKLVAPFRNSLASARSYYLIASSAASRKPEVREFADWLCGEAQRADAGAA
jgi:LysR family transcriptional regulator, glycine cleavage system transcriptional activator